MIASMLFLGLKPQGSFGTEWVSLNTKNSEVKIERYGYLQGELLEFSDLVTPESSLEFLITLKTKKQIGSKFKVILFIGNNCESNPVIVGQLESKLVLMHGCDFPNNSHEPQHSQSINVQFNVSIDAALTLSIDSSVLVVNGSTVSLPNDRNNPEKTAADTIYLIGNSADGRHGWRGKLLHLEIQNVHQYNLIERIVEPLHRYNFSEIIKTNYFKDELISNTTLNIPKVGNFPKRIFLEQAPLNELWKSIKTDVLINFFGFMPLGFLSAMCLHFCVGFRGNQLFFSSLTIAIILSLSIELSQVTIAGRRSALHDLILNAAGSIFATLLYIVTSNIQKFKNKKNT